LDHGRPQEIFQGVAKKLFLPLEGLKNFPGGAKKFFFYLFSGEKVEK
jgi:hypothetical protein